MANVEAKAATDMTTWDLTDLRDGTPATNTATEWEVNGVGVNRYVFTGTGLTYGSETNPLPDGGTLDTFKLKESGTTTFTVDGSIDAALAGGFVSANDRVGLQTEWFKNADTFDGSTGDDHLLSYNGADVFGLGDGGEDWAEGGRGDDTFNIDGALSAGDIFDGGQDSDTLNITGTNFYDFSASGLIGVETVVASGGSNQLTFVKENIGNVGLTVDGSAIGSSDFFGVFIDSAANKPVTAIGGAGADFFTGGRARDTWIGNNGNDFVRGMSGGDTLTGDSGSDRFIYLQAIESTSVNYDEITDFDTTGDKIGLNHGIKQVNPALTTGTLSTATFDADMEAAITSAVMGKYDVLLFTPDAGDLAGLTFLLIDDNNKGGYRANKDIVILMGPDSDLSSLNKGDFEISG